MDGFDFGDYSTIVWQEGLRLFDSERVRFVGFLSVLSIMDTKADRRDIDAFG